MMDKKSITPEQFIEAFGCAFSLHYVQRGAGSERRYVWMAEFTAHYFTSDTDRFVNDHSPPLYPNGFGETIGEALADLAIRRITSEERSSRDWLEKATSRANEVAANAERVRRAIGQ
jgi:hypothetical protein